MSNPEKVYAFLTGNVGVWFCYDCLAKRTGMNRAEVNTVVRSMALPRGSNIQHSQDNACSACTSAPNKHVARAT